MGDEDKKKSWGGGSKDNARRAKVYKTTGRVEPAKKTQGNGAQALGLRRLWRELFGDD